MSKIPGDLRYTKDHEWIRLEGGTGVMGITDYAQHAMGDVVYVELPDVGRKVAAGDDFVVVESVKGANDVFSPVSGTVTGSTRSWTARPSWSTRTRTPTGLSS